MQLSQSQITELTHNRYPLPYVLAWDDDDEKMLEELRSEYAAELELHNQALIEAQKNPMLNFACRIIEHK